MQERIFKNDHNIHYTGAVHEVLKHKKNRGLNFYDASDSITIFHTGYSKKEVERKNKSERNLNLLFKELRKKPNDLLTLFYIGESMMVDTSFQDALPYLQKARKMLQNSRFKTHPLLYKIFCDIFICMLRLNEDMETFKKTYEQAQILDKECPDFHFYMGKKLFTAGQYDDAIEFYDKCFKYIGTYKYSFESKVLPQMNNIYEELLDLYIITENPQKIVQTSITLLRVNKFHYKSLYILTKTLKEAGESQAVISHVLFSIYSKTSLKDQLYILRVVETLALNQLYDKVLNLLTEDERTQYIQYKEQENKDL
ncbi:hypothetical protein [Heyndrickxia coagulans]|uniref:hypothetical protein n=1 Tax=Heyndrickxia coagulans TaxID=1398 RepID=UPI0018A7AFA5|nr:hypothetical protein [Heyndrickxia coagulans]MBF8416864.1 hypothetical protein [Heyndrickxia coagulans]